MSKFTDLGKNWESMSNEILLGLVRVGGFRVFDDFTPYTSGEIGNYKIESTDIQKDGALSAKVIDYMGAYIAEVIGMDSFDAISGGESADWGLSFPLAYALEKPHVQLYKRRSVRGLTSISGKRILHVADVNNEGSSFANSWYPQLNINMKAIVEDVLFLFDRMEGGHQVVENLGVRRHSLIDLTQEAWKMLVDKKAIAFEVYEDAMARLEDKTAWAEAKLKTDTGYNRLVDLLRNGESAKAYKIIDYVPYRVFMDEIEERLLQDGIIEKTETRDMRVAIELLT